MADNFIRSESIVWRRIDEKIAIIGTDASAIFVLNKTAAKIWELCDGSKRPEEMSACICECFEVSPQEAEADVRNTISRFKELGLLEKKEHLNNKE